MSLFVASLNSGSNGNCYYIGNKDEAILIDAGLSCRETEKRMQRMGLSLQKVKAIFVSHEHSDHIKGLSVLAGKFRLPVYITAETLQHSRMTLPSELVFPFSGANPIMIGALKVTPFSKFHDAVDPYSFIVEGNATTIGIFTDLGRVCEPLKAYFRLCHAAFLETNYDEEMLEQGKYPYHLKNRIKGGNGHLSNREALTLFQTEKATYLSHLFLAHLSRENNDEDRVHQLFCNHAGKTEIIVASRHGETKVYEIKAWNYSFVKEKSFPPKQLSLF